ncbi:MAG: DUF2344 domain-containing protein [Clostridiaceae bacterium]|nr:DUF2344 domain-containing protein [Clostridiaceae bacterium]
MAKSLRFRFSRGEGLKYLAHLDILRVFERALKRSGLNVSYTQGFNPRQRLVFGLPMSIGLTSEAEYADIVLEEDVTPEYFIETLNRSLPEGIRLHEAVELNNKENIMNQIAAARYIVPFETSEDISQEEMENLIYRMLSKEEILVEKKTKKGMRQTNIRQMIYSISATKKGSGIFELEAFLSAGAESNLRADLLMEAIKKETGLDIRVISIHRKALYASTFNEWKNPLEVANA